MGASQSGCGSSPYEVDTRVATGPIFDSILNVPETRKDTLRAAEAVEKLLCKDATALQANIFVRQFVSEWLTSRSTRARPGKTTMEIVNVATLIEFVAICLGFGHADANCEAKLSIEDVFFHMFAEKESPEVLFSEFLELLCDITAAPPPAHDAIKQAHETALQTNKAKRSGPKPFCEFVASWLREALPFALPTMQNWMECQLLGPNQYIGGICETDSEAARLPPHVAQFFQKWSTVTIFSQRRMVPALGLWSTIQLRVSAEQLPTTPSSVLFRCISRHNVALMCGSARLDAACKVVLLLRRWRWELDVRSRVAAPKYLLGVLSSLARRVYSGGLSVDLGYCMAIWVRICA
eukprot:m.529524 g.529524  ORF g.529524 m.529524 type:complete len:351 (-) comp22019_c0_seq4:1701-2753(-)